MEASDRIPSAASACFYFFRILCANDARIILSTNNEFCVCTRPAATPDMDATKALLLMKERVVKYLFVPVIRRDTREPS